ncbi:MAG: nitrogenase component 1 [Elusimicrobiota bacterium]
MSRALADLCGLDGAWRLRSASRQEAGRVRLAVARGHKNAVVILRPAPAKNCFVRAGAFDICYEGKTAGRELTDLLRQMARRLKRCDPQRLIAALPQDKQNKKNGDGGEGEAPDAQCVSDRLGGNPGQWRRFFCEREFSRMFFWAHATGFVGRVLYFVHGDFDCTFMPPDVTFRGMTFLNYPPVHPHSQDSPLPDTVYEQWTSDLQEKDVILGTAGKLNAFLHKLKERTRPDLIMISWSCTPTVIGDDEQAMAAKCRDAGGCPVVMNSINFRMQKSFSLFEEIFREVRGTAAFRRVKPDPAAVNLLDCPPRFFREELAPLLAAAGIRVNARIFPEVHLPTLHRYPAAACQVLPEYLRAIPTVQRTLTRLPLETIYAPAPFGVEGTRRYLRAVTAPYGKAPAAAAWSRREWRRRKARWDELTRRARGHRLAFVADEASLGFLLAPGFQTGVPVLRMIAEMGFGAEFLVFAPQGREPKNARRLKALPGFQRPPRLRFFSAPQGLEQALANGDFSAAYSDIFFDHRLTRAGKPQFSMRTFEAGMDGALRSLERLLDICRLPFYARYRKHLRRAGRTDA